MHGKRPGWSGAYTVGELASAGRVELRYACSACGRKGVAAIADLLDADGAGARLPEIRMPIAQALGCDRHDAAGHNACRLGYVPRRRIV